MTELKIALVEDAIELLREAHRLREQEAPACASPGEIALFLIPQLDRHLETLREEYQQQIDQIVISYTLSQSGPQLLQSSLEWALTQARDDATAKAESVCGGPASPAEREAWLEEEFARLVGEAEQFVRSEMEAFLEDTNLVDLGIILLGAGLLGLMTAALTSTALASIPSALAAAQAAADRLAARARSIPRVVKWFNRQVVDEVKNLVQSAGGLTIRRTLPPEIWDYLETLPRATRDKVVNYHKLTVEATDTLNDIARHARGALEMVYKHRTPDVAQKAADMTIDLLEMYTKWEKQVTQLRNYVAPYRPELQQLYQELGRLQWRGKKALQGLGFSLGKIRHAIGEWETVGTSVEFSEYLRKRMYNLNRYFDLAVASISSQLAQEILAEHPEAREEDLEGLAEEYRDDIEARLEEAAIAEIEAVKDLPLSQIGIEPPSGFPLELRTIADLLDLPETVEVG